MNLILRQCWGLRQQLAQTSWSLVFALAIVVIRLAHHLRRKFARASLGELYVLFTLALAYFRHI